MKVFETKCYRDEDAKAVGLNNRDDLIRKECKEAGGEYTGKWKDCGNWYFSGECRVPSWGPWRNEGCVTPTTKKYVSRLWDIVGSWEVACENAIKNPGSEIQGEIVDRKCINRGAEGMWGEIFVKADDCKGTWGTFTNECDDIGRKKFFSKLSVPPNIKWEDACAEKIKEPTKLPTGDIAQGQCVSRVDGIYGEWFIQDPTCKKKTSAVAEDIGTSTQSIVGGLVGGLSGIFGGGGSTLMIIVICIVLVISLLSSLMFAFR